LLIFGVPKVNLQAELKAKLQGFGKLQSCISITSEMASKSELEPNHFFLFIINFLIVELEAFTDVFAVKFERLEVARRAKKMLDARQFFGGILHISYAPERESIDELREKMVLRRQEVAQRIRSNQQDQPHAPKKSREAR